MYNPASSRIYRIKKARLAMKCPACEEQIGWDWVEDEGIEPNETFECPECDESLMYKIDESTYYGAQHFTVEIADD